MVDSVPDDFYPALGIADAEGFERADDGRIEFEGLPNTRDLGGLPSVDGRFVKRARLLRSGALARATERDLKVLADEFDLRTVVDLRTEEERREHPDPEDALLDVRFRDAPVLSASTFGVNARRRDPFGPQGAAGGSEEPGRHDDGRVCSHGARRAKPTRVLPVLPRRFSC